MLEFADALVERAAAKARAEIERQSDVEYIPKKEAINLLGVCDATLWHWARSGYLVPVKLGRRVFYRCTIYMSIDRISYDITADCSAKGDIIKHRFAYPFSFSNLIMK
ncbi:MAG: helix-turn-helix domain-containing protein [Bacteroidales bacterium]|nr:helix-turn-helix domain-containing protein [Bacteroidales bacterium]